MTLKAVRADFIEFSGRYDLVADTVDFADTGADKFIRAGQRWLDRKFVISKQAARWYGTAAPGGWYAITPLMRAAHDVWMSTAEGRWKLHKLTLDELRHESAADPAKIDGGRPQVWAPTSLRTVLEVPSVITVDRIGEATHNTAGDHFGYNGVLWLPPVAQATTIEVQGLFLQPELHNDQDRNYWTEFESHALVMAGCRALEQSYRNTQGMMDWETAIVQELLGLEFDLADAESIGVDGMEGTL